MKKFISMLSLVAIVASAMFVSCAKSKEPTLVPAFPYNKTATYAQNEETMVYGWTWDSDDAYKASKGTGFQLASISNEILEYLITPNASWTATVVGEGAAYVQVGQGYGFENENYTWGTVVEGNRGLNSLYFKVLKKPESFEAAVTVEIELSMCGEKMVVATLVIEPQL